MPLEFSVTPVMLLTELASVAAQNALPLTADLHDSTLARAVPELLSSARPGLVEVGTERLLGVRWAFNGAQAAVTVYANDWLALIAPTGQQLTLTDP